RAAGKTAHRELRRPLHEQDHAVLLDEVIDALLYVAHGLAPAGPAEFRVEGTTLYGKPRVVRAGTRHAPGRNAPSERVRHAELQHRLQPQLANLVVQALAEVAPEAAGQHADIGGEAPSPLDRQPGVADANIGRGGAVGAAVRRGIDAAVDAELAAAARAAPRRGARAEQHAAGRAQPAGGALVERGGQVVISHQAQAAELHG